MSKYIPESCPLLKYASPDESEYTEENCSGCEYQCMASSVARLKHAAQKAASELFEAIVEAGKALSEKFGSFLHGFQLPDIETIKRRKNHVRTWKRRGPRNGKSKKDH